ncbi:monovalent cation:H+ antiporter, CPA1 (nhx1) [Sporothrix epigloea]|uniref:Sodium/hydrogen exchanger n=1 Tax=Sporothrix epigloea TaxID=1892477 RepID=A0ABP0DD40_9PEZI
MTAAAIWSLVAGTATEVVRRANDETDSEGGDSSKKEIYASWAIFILIMLLIVAFFTSYILQQQKVTAVHETVVSIFAGMTVGLILRVTAGDSIRDLVSFDYQIFFNLLLPPIILSSGYELHQGNFFRNIGTILTFAFFGTFLSAIVIGVILWLYTRIPLEGLSMNWIDAISVGATLSATDPVTILAIFNSYKVDPKLYTIIFGESILNDAIAIVIFETAQKSKTSSATSSSVVSLIKGIGIFLKDFFGSLLIGALVGIMAALCLKYTYLRRYSKIESCLIVLIAYATYFFSQAVHMSGIVSLLFCGITLKHYAYFNMSRRTQLTTKYFFQVLAQLSENFIFIYLGLSLFTENDLQYQPLLIIVTIMAVCVARWVAVFPLSKAINWFIHYRERRRGIVNSTDELPYNYQAMLFWAGLRGAVGVALAALLTGNDTYALKATVLVVVVLTVIIFGGTTARMLEILGIRTGVVDEIDSDDEFDIEPVGSYVKRGGGIGYNPPRNPGQYAGSPLPLNRLNNGVGSGAGSGNGMKRGYYPSGSADDNADRRSWATGVRSPNSASGSRSLSRKNSVHDLAVSSERPDLLGYLPSVTDSDDGSDIDTSDLPPPAARRRSSPMPPGTPELYGIHAASGSSRGAAGPVPPTASANPSTAAVTHMSATDAIRQLWNTEDPTALLRQLDEDFIKPKLLLDGGTGRGNGGSNHLSSSVRSTPKGGLTAPTTLDATSTNACIMLDEGLPTFIFRPIPDNPSSAVVYYTRGGSEPAPEYVLVIADPVSKPACHGIYAAALTDPYNGSDVVYGEVVVTPEWQQPTLSAVELREHRERGSEAAGASPTPKTPSLFSIQLYNPDQAVTIRHLPSSWNRTESWEFEVPIETFRMPSASRLDRQQAAAAATAAMPLATAPKNVFRWKRDSRLGNKDMTCYLVGQALGAQRSKEPDITVALFKHGRDPAVTVYEPNLQRVDVQDRKGLDLVLLLSAQGIRDLYLSPRPDTFNMTGAPAGTGRRKNSRPVGTTMSVVGQVSHSGGGNSSSTAAAGKQHMPHAASGVPNEASAPPVSSTGSHGTKNKIGVASSAPSSAAIDAETKRLQVMLEREEKERAKRVKEEERQIKKMLEAEEKERRLREAQVAKETERLRRTYGVDGQELPSAMLSPTGPPPSLPLRPVPRPPQPPTSSYGPNHQHPSYQNHGQGRQTQRHGQANAPPRPVSVGPSSWQHGPSNESTPSTSGRPARKPGGFFSSSAAHISDLFSSSSSLSGNRDRSSSVVTDERRRIQKKQSV